MFQTSGIVGHNLISLVGDGISLSTKHNQFPLHKVPNHHLSGINNIVR
jgi:hypothetical protein